MIRQRSPRFVHRGLRFDPSQNWELQDQFDALELIKADEKILFDCLAELMESWGIIDTDGYCCRLDIDKMFSERVWALIRRWAMFGDSNWGYSSEICSVSRWYHFPAIKVIGTTNLFGGIRGKLGHYRIEDKHFSNDPIAWRRLPFTIFTIFGNIRSQTSIWLFSTSRTIWAQLTPARNSHTRPLSPNTRYCLVLLSHLNGWKGNEEFDGGKSVYLVILSDGG